MPACRGTGSDVSIRFHSGRDADAGVSVDGGSGLVGDRVCIDGPKAISPWPLLTMMPSTPWPKVVVEVALEGVDGDRAQLVHGLIPCDCAD